MRIIFASIFVSTILYSQQKNIIDHNNLKQGEWHKKYQNGSLKYKGQFKDGIPYGTFLHYYNTGELKIEKKYFHNGTASSCHFYYKMVS